MSSTSAFKDLLLQASDINTLSLHSGDPGAAGTNNEVTGSGTSGTYSRQSCTFAAASGGEKALSANVDFFTPDSQPVTYVGFWATGTFRGSKLLSGDTAANSIGQFRITTATKLTMADV